ncbi:hypothetical protein C8F04DRAFT_948297, partial [Mycena alexandri]
NTSGESKIAVCKRIGSVIFPDLFATSPNALAKRVEGKMHNPRHDTTEQAQNLWGLSSNCICSSVSYIFLPDEIEEDFPFFPRLHRFLASRSNIVPLMIATGVGPEGRKVVHLQPPTRTMTDLDPNIDPSLQVTPHRPRQDSPSSPIEIDSSPLAPVNKNSQGKTAPRPSTFHSAVEDAKTLKPRPSQKSFEESIIDIQM